ncbi:TonB-dependent siderophore receptor [Neisseria leonii]|uniref:TonB-dependent siderophore receptor n=1 Tax=Neisseria leonii TaxID=2995413 RepID=UPI00237B9918|nr:TonB-dependent siderophore receptor [Neisseria sp. 3986]MDD9325779.1 TonB-dependent siderophore receptor [Neisseria sp. 3986]
MKTSRLIFRLAPLPALFAAAFASAAEQAELERVDVYGTRNAARYEYVSDSAQTRTAAKTDGSLMDVPQSSSTVTRRHLDEREPQDIAETLAYTSGVSGGYRGENTHIEMSVRGIGGKSNGGGQPTFWDGLRYGASLEINPYIIDRIDILKGPASMLYGQSNPGGIVNLMTKQATGSNESEIVLKTGSGNRAEIGLDIDKEWNGQLAYRLVANAKQVDWQAGKQTRQRSLTLAPSLMWRPTERTKLVLKGLYERQPEAGDRNFLISDGTLFPVDRQRIPLDFFSGDPDYHNLNNTKNQIGYELEHKFNDNLSLQQNLRYGAYNNYLKSLVVWNSLGGSNVRRMARIFDENWREFQADTRLVWKTGSDALRHTVLFGADYQDSRSGLKSYLGDAPPIDWRKPVYGVAVDTPALSGDEKSRVRQTGLYLQDRIEWGNWRFLLGGRYDMAGTSQENRFRATSNSHSDNKFTWRAGAVYRFSDGLSAYANYATSFLPEAGISADGGSLKPTTANQVEVGVKYRPTPRVLLTGALFNINQSNLSVYDPVTWQKTQVGKVRTRGAEIEVQGDITPQWGISGSYTYLDKKVREDSNPALVGTTQWGVPKHSASLWLDYRFGSQNPLKGLSIGTGLRHTGKTWGDNANTFRVPAYTVWDMKLAYKPGSAVPALKGTQVQLNVQNLAGKQYVASCANRVSCFYGKGRVWTLSGGYRW